VYEPTDLGGYTAELASAFRSLVERAGLRFVVEGQRAEAFVDRDMWEKIVFNLLSNAFKHTFEGEIRVAVRDAGARVELAVSDTGVGIAAGDRPHIFERFHRIAHARARTHEGTGIGLALVAELVKLHGGSIEVSSEVDRGSTFVLSLPKGSSHLPAERIGGTRSLRSTALGPTPYVEEARRWMLDEGGAGLTAEPLPPVAMEVPSAHILLADDNADMREYVRQLLGRHWSVEAVADGAAALAVARARPPDLVVADVMMPGLDGFELLRALRAEARTRTVPVVLLSARAGEESRVEGLDAGADDYLIKPFSARELVARVNAHLKLATARRQFAVALERERAKLEIVLRQMPAGVVIVDAETRAVVLTNNEAARILGAAVAFETADSFPEASVLRPDGRPYPREEWPVMRSLRGEVVTDEELRFARGGGVTLTLAASSAPVHGADGRVLAAVVVFQDVSERLALLARERAAHAEAEAANRAKDQFLAVLSHELRTPLSAIMGWTRLLQRADVAETQRAHAAQVIERNVERQAQLVNDLLDVSRIAAGKLELDRFPVDLALVIRDAVDSLRAEVEAKNLELRTALDPAGRGQPGPAGARTGAHDRATAGRAPRRIRAGRERRPRQGRHVHDRAADHRRPRRARVARERDGGARGDPGRAEAAGRAPRARGRRPARRARPGRAGPAAPWRRHAHGGLGRGGARHPRRQPHRRAGERSRHAGRRRLRPDRRRPRGRAPARRPQDAGAGADRLHRPHGARARGRRRLRRPRDEAPRSRRPRRPHHPALAPLIAAPSSALRRRRPWREW
jgi:signal transduction histidine kinase